MTWQILIAISIILYSVSVVLQRKILKNNTTDPISFAILFQFGVSIVVGIIVLLFWHKIVIPDLRPVWIGLLAMSVLYGLANIFIFRSLKLTEASKFTVIFSSKTFFAILGVWLFFGEKLNSNQMIGAVLIFVGIIVVSGKEIFHKINKGDLFAVLAAAFFGLANTTDRYLIGSFDPYSYVVIGFFLPGVFISLMHPKKVAEIGKQINPNFLTKLIPLLIMYGFSAAAFFSAMQKTTNTSQLFSINSVSSVVVVVFAAILLKEKDHFGRKLLASIIGLAGLVLLNI